MRGICLLVCIVSFAAFAQGQPNAICAEGDCPAALFTIQLDDPATGGYASAERTERFRQAYLSFKQIRKTYALDEDWQDKRDESQLGGKSCLRHYQLEAHFAHEYVFNPDFKQFVDAQGDGNRFVEKGFESSGKGINLKTRMDRNCPEALRDAGNKGSPSVEKLPEVYQKLGQVLGYFDEKGQLLKPLEEPAPKSSDPADPGKMSKKEQITQMKQQVAQLPVGQDVRDQIGSARNALTDARPKLGLLQGALDIMGSRLATFLPGPLGLIGKIKTVNNTLGVLKNFVPKISVPGLLSKIGDLFRRGKDLADKAKALADQSGQIKDRYDDINKQSEDVQSKMDERLKNLDDLQTKMDELAQKKADLEAKLNDKPRKILEELQQQVGDAVSQGKDLTDKLADAVKAKDQLLDKLDELSKAKDALEEQLKDMEKQFADLTKDQETLAAETNQAEQEVAGVKKQEEKVDGLKKEIDALKPADDIKGEIALCEADLKQLLEEITGVKVDRDRIKGKLDGLLAKPGALLARVTDLKQVQDKLKLPQNGIPVAEKTLAKLDKLSDKATAIGSIAEILTGRETKLLEKVGAWDARLGVINDAYTSRQAKLEQLKAELADLLLEKSGVRKKLDGTIEDVNVLETTVRDFIERYQLLDRNADCPEQKDLKKEVEELKKDQKQTEPEVGELEQDMEKAGQETQQIEEQTKQVEQEIGEQVQQEAELQQEERTIREEYGKDMELEPVKPEEWAESFEVKRPYWEALFHPDDEVVEGQKGRYYEVRLRDADKNIKLLFSAGQYCMSKSEFRKRYGSTIGAFVTEALNAMKKSDQQKVKLFIQGSADIVGQNTFSGKIDEQFYYEKVAVLPRKDDHERFSGTPVDREIPVRNFRNNHLPDLRARYLSEMIQAYSKKFEPVVLEGTVKDFKDEEERNAIIYLFIPEELVVKYSGE